MMDEVFMFVLQIAIFSRAESIKPNCVWGVSGQMIDDGRPGLACCLSVLPSLVILKIIQ